MPQENLIRLISKKCPGIVYYTAKNKKKVERKLEFKKFCKITRKHEIFTEAKKK
ncbi:MAG: 50S ribosomal protein L33 [Candidatus Spechtbacteria bacterium RIFCSPLOWO2_01_FULL_46_10]|uniref:Large ribosomal subunit protein bL33 n=1 Tax=Candidatus Spechtbacteria bacterium RIFCSPLOWO2_01_FULL_46_10 TaxID=1802163 RepID=A0A1G2HHH2_9BACT|nr:MAG: 50S ribosomal protein L33 [Candidatus Spechtbacteria bacterium RIFCSPLOWO2_01_FULL_46_10]